MTDENKILWECPTCSSQFGKHEIAGLINRIELWLKDRPSPSMDCNSDLVERNIWLLGELKSLHKTYIRKPSRMMEAQNAIGASEVPGVSQEIVNKFSGAIKNVADK